MERETQGRQQLEEASRRYEAKRSDIASIEDPDLRHAFQREAEAEHKAGQYYKDSQNGAYYAQEHERIREENRREHGSADVLEHNRREREQEYGRSMGY